MTRASWNDTVIAESNETEIVEGNHYFPLDSLAMEHFSESDTKSVCHWKGVARYYTIVVGDQKNVDAAWYIIQAPSRQHPRSPERSRSGRASKSSPDAMLDTIRCSSVRSRCTLSKHSSSGGCRSRIYNERLTTRMDTPLGDFPRLRRAEAGARGRHIDSRGYNAGRKRSSLRTAWTIRG
jgi:hypothetical protein